MDMKFSFTTLTTPDYTIEQIIENAKRYGYDGVDIRVSQNRGELTVESSREQIENVKNSFQNAGIAIPSLLCYMETCKVMTGDTTEFEDWLKHHIEIGEQVGAQAIRLFTHDKKSCSNRFPYVDIYAEALHKVLSAQKTSLQILIQNHQYYSTAEEALYIIKKVNLPNVQLVYSHDHCQITGENVVHIFDELIGHTRQLYIADAVERDGEFVSVLPGEGILPISRLCRACLQKGFEGFVTFKWYNIYQPELAKADKALPYFISYMKKMSSQNSGSIRS